MSGKLFTCDICGKQEIGYPNNPFPYLDKGCACTECNMSKVLQARLMGLSIPLHKLDSEYIRHQREQLTLERESETV